ncbi:hypothetical protein [Sneathia sanguinegens]|uniref:hypothetical protein n=1 Tax=Sneathia sanguinegens TaxID=40543 RepID=UPI00082F35A2|nr:hypothetical protein [Sneathia sanguinegens]
MKKIVMGILLLVFQLIGFSDNFLGTWIISDLNADYEVFTIFQMDNKYYKAVRYDDGSAIISKLDRKNNKLYAIDDEEKYVYSYDEKNNRLIETIDNEDCYEKYSKIDNNEDLSMCNTYIFPLNSKILKKTRENVKYQDFLVSYSDMSIANDGRYYYIHDYSGCNEILNAKNKELFNENIKVYFSEITQPFIDGLNIKNLKAGDKVLTVEYDDVLGRNGEFYYINKTNED